jgi:chemosensory pili system protein ChpA (sensor histidine kinase/response regulator)
MTRSLTDTALGWVREDLDKLHEQLRMQVENIANNPMAGDSAYSQTAETAEQLMLTFDILKLEGVKQVMAEIVSLCTLVRDGEVSDREQATAALMDAIVVLPAYLDRMQAGHHDLPVLLQPLINKLREAGGAEPVSEGTLFMPLLDVELPELEIVRRPGYDEPFEYFINRMLRQYESALNNWLAEQDRVSLLSPLQGICETLRHRIKSYTVKRLWWVATEVTGGLMEGHIENDVQLRRLLARLQHLLKALAEGGEEAVDETTITSVTQALLYHVARARRGNRGLALVSERFELARLLPDREALMRARGTLAGRDRDMYQSLCAAVQDELAMVKDSLDLEQRTGHLDQDSQAQIAEVLQGLGDTLGMLGLSGPAAELMTSLSGFEASAEAGGANRAAVLEDLASRLLLIESALAEQVETLGEPVEREATDSYIELPYYEQLRIRSKLLDEAVISVHQAQECIRQRLGGDRDADPTPPLEHVAGALRLIGESRVSELTSGLVGQLGQKLHKAYSEAAVNPGHLDAIADATAALELYLASRRDQQQESDRFVEILEDRLTQLSVEAAPPAPAPETTPEVPETVQPEPPSPVGSGLPATPPPAAPVQAKAEPVTQAAPDAKAEDRLPDAMDPELREIFLEEYESVLESLHHAIPQWLNKLDDVAALTDIRRAFHTLKGSGRMVGAEELGDFSWQIEDMLNSLLEGQVENFADISVMVRLAQASLPSLRQRLLQEPSGLSGKVIAHIGQQAQELGRGLAGDWDDLSGQLPAYLAGMLPGSIVKESPASAVSLDKDELQSMLGNELQQNLEPIQALLEAISKDRATRADQDQLRALHTIATALSMQPEAGDAEIAGALETVFQAQAKSGRRFSNEAMWTLVSASGHIQARLDRLQGLSDAEPPDDQEELLRHLKSLTEELSGPAMEEPADASPATTGQDEAEFDPGQSVFASGSDGAEEYEAPAAPPAPEPAALAPELDAEIIPIFLEEAAEVLERSDSLLNQWRDDLQQLRWVRNLQREIHTFKGGARMGGLTGMGEFSHSMETLLEQIAGKVLPPSMSAVQVLEDACDRLQVWVEEVSVGTVPNVDNALALLTQQIDSLKNVSTSTEVAPPVAAPERAVHEIPESEVAAPEPVDEPSGPSHIRVAADLLDSLVNAAGEVSIFRSRLEQQVGGLRSNLSEFDETIARLREQFRKLDIEIETQVRSNYPDASKAAAEGFDPLELDEFSTLHQLSRSLSESVSDLLNLQEMLEDNTRKSEKLLTQQSRVSTELQEGLMKTRMVPFGSVAPRLRRLVRSAAKETGKQARLQLQMVGTSDELDRNVLETITAPLEHMIRNSVVHGIETPDQRRELGKDKQGEIAITVESEATEFVIRIEDDGAGIDTGAIFKRAVERGLLDSDAKPRRQQLYNLMLDSGFSTSDKVTGLAGRGVGMDVVVSEIKHIGGSLEIDSQPGEGSRFTIRIPFTLAVMQAIGLMAGDQRYLLPLSCVAGVARILPADYQKLVSEPDPQYNFAGQKYPVLDIEPLLQERSRPLGRDNVTLLIVSAGEQRAAFRIPELLPHREVVIKPVGPQISSVPGILGGSISADGEVVVILDPGPLIRQALVHGVSPAVTVSAAEHASDKPLVMVVDDSITMRKVTSRVLEENNFDVLTARDGVDATEKLQDRTPDIMLLDIEMPRMDGYELTEYIRDDARLRKIPIMMITSRAGQKHRDRATQAGANAYMTKPYSESELILEVNRLLLEEAS